MNSCGIDLDLNTIQAIRLVSAIAESDYLVHVKEEDYQIFEFLKMYFDFKVEAGVVGVPILTEVSINHKAPSCTIGSITKPLIFPRAVFDLCRSKWKTERKITYYFSGLLTDKRMSVLQKWISSHSTKSKLRSHLNYLFIRIHNRLLQSKTMKVKKGFASKLIIRLGNGEHLHLVSSTIGRNFPEKSWDDNYFNQMSNSKFVLCPDGDYVWTYRFVEAIMCGAIPIVENEADMYSGFHYYKLNDHANQFLYDKRCVLENYELALDRFTISTEVLNKEIMNLLDKRRE